MRSTVPVLAFLASLTFPALAGCKRDRPVLTLATTTSVQDTGLFDRLEPVVEARIGADVRMIAVGSGQAILLARKGEADVVIAHSPEDELAAVADGALVDRQPLMWNRFLVVGPPGDPASVRDAVDVLDAFRRIATSGAVFLSRGDQSGTHKKEIAIWQATGVTRPAGMRETGQGQGETLLIADELGAYTMADSSTASRTRVRRLVTLYDPAEKQSPRGPTMLNAYSILRANPAKNPGIATETAKSFQKWMTGTEAAAIIGSGGLFSVGAPPSS